MKRSLALIILLLASCSETPSPINVSAQKSKAATADDTKNLGSKTAQVDTSGASTSTSTNSQSGDAVATSGTTKDNTTTDGMTTTTSTTTMGTTDQTKVDISPTTGIAKVAVVPSPGCNKAPTQALGKYFTKKVDGMDRNYQLYLPANYDKTKPYRLLMMGHGCGGTDDPFKMDTVAKDQAIIVAMKSSGSCFIYEMKVEGPYFDEVLKEVSNDTCVDTNRVFVAGFSSGSWLTNMLGCARSNVIRSQGNATGNLPGGLPTCVGPIPAFMVHDDMDTVNSYAGGEIARDRILKINSCSTETEPYAYNDDPKTASACVKYKGCTPGYPVVWCRTSGKGHTPNSPISTEGFWKFWSGF